MLTLLLFAAIGISADFEGGNIGKVETLSARRLRCHIEGQSDQDRRNRQANWYYFKLDRLPRGQAVTIDLVDMAGEYNYRGPVFPVSRNTRPVYSYDGTAWSHFSSEQVEWDDKEPRLRLMFTPERAEMWIAHTPPYTNRDLSQLLASFRGDPRLEWQSAGKTVERREMPLLTITNPRIPLEKKKVIWLMFRQHAWESGSSWVCDGAVRFLLSNGERAAAIRDGVVFRIFPMADPDGVAHGGVRFNRNGFDLNRNWDAVNPQRMPEIAAQRKAILDWVDSGHPLHLFLTVHNTETNEYLQAPAMFRELGRRVFDTLTQTTTFHPTSPLRDSGQSTTPGMRGRMTVDQGLFHDRKLPAMLMEQMIGYNSKLGHYPTIQDRKEFGAQLARALAEAAGGVKP
jgi:hypothetical protein